MVRYLMCKDGFYSILGEVCTYSFPTSEYYEEAKTNPLKVAQVAIADELEVLSSLLKMKDKTLFNKRLEYHKDILSRVKTVTDNLTLDPAGWQDDPNFVYDLPEPVSD